MATSRGFKLLLILAEKKKAAEKLFIFWYKRHETIYLKRDLLLETKSALFLVSYYPLQIKMFSVQSHIRSVQFTMYNPCYWTALEGQVLAH